MYRELIHKDVACCVFLVSNAMYQISVLDRYWPFLHKKYQHQISW